MVTTSFEWRPVAGEFTVASADTNDGPPVVQPLSSGGYLVVWDQDRAAVFGQPLALTGQPAADGPIFYNSGRTFHGALDGVLTADGKIALSWPAQAPGGSAVYLSGDLIHPDGSGVDATFGVQLQSAAVDQSVAALAGGDVVVAWADSGKPSSGPAVPQQVHAAIFNPDGTTATADIQVAANPDTSHPDFKVAAAGLAGGDFVVAWRGASDDFAIFNPSGGTVVGATLIDTPADTGAAHRTIDVTGLADGGFVVVYDQHPAGDSDPNRYDVVAEVFNADGTNRTGPMVVNSDHTGAHYDPMVSTLTSGAFLVGWTAETAGGTAFEAQAFDDQGYALGQNLTASAHPGTIVGDDGLALGAAVSGGSGGPVVTSWIDALVHTGVGDSGDDTIAGYQLPDDFAGMGGNDCLAGGTAGDTLDGGSGDDYLWGGAGNNLLLGGEGNDKLDAGGDGDNSLAGGAGNDYLYARGGNDTLDGGAGSDTLTGGAGADRFVFDALADSSNAHPDTIVDFQHGVDKIDLHGMAQGLSWAGSTPTADAVWFTVSAQVTVIHIDAHTAYVGSDATINLYGTNLGLTASDFVF